MIKNLRALREDFVTAATNITDRDIAFVKLKQVQVIDQIIEQTEKEYATIL